jgi:hypothetical protein
MIGLPLEQYNVINGNGAANNDCDIRGVMGAALEISYTKISPAVYNPTTGLCVSRNSIARIYGSVVTISNNNYGISMKLGGSLIVQGISQNFNIVSGNRSGAITCSGTESHLEPFTKDSTGNIVIPGVWGSISGNCTGF